MLRFTRTYIGFSCLLTMILGGCASRSGESAGSAAGIGVGNSGQQQSNASNVKDPSPIDLQRPPTVVLSGVGEGDLILGSTLSLKVDVSNYPIERDWQLGVVSLNGVEVERLDSPSSKVDVKGLREGFNQVSVHLLRSWGESLKTPSASVAIGFYYKKKDSSAANVQKGGAPGLVLISPGGSKSNSFSGESAKKVMFDFLVTQSQGRKYRIYYTLNGDTREVAAEGAPYFFYNLPKGNHSLKVELVDSKGKPVRAPYAQAESTFRID